MKHSTAVKQEENELPEGEGRYPEEESAEDEEQRLADDETMQLFGTGLQRLFDKQVGLKEEIEQRWLEDLRHYHGRYDTQTAKQFKTGKRGSQLFVNLTRSTSNTAESKLSDLVLPTDDRNWGLKSTPVPELVKSLKDDQEVTLDDGSVAVNPDELDPETQEPTPYKASDLAQETIKQAEKTAELMQTEIDDQLKQAKFNAVCRRIIHDAVVIGTGIIKGPMVERSAKKAWIENETGEWTLSTKEENKPTATFVDPWNFFPDMSAVRWEDSEFTFERHLMTKKDLRKLAKNPGFMKKQIAMLLQNQPNARTAKLTYLNELREINGITQIQQDNRYEVLEYHGPIEKEHLQLCGCEVDEDDNLEEFEGVVWFCLGVVIKVGLNHMDSNEMPYNILNWEKDDTSTFGFGVPYRMRGPQKAVNASWRMIMDNAGLATGPQILINKNMVEPADGVWELTPRKIWFLTSDDPKVRADYAMQAFNVDSHQNELIEIFESAKRLVNEETSVPVANMSNQSPDTQQPAMMKTLGGTQLWMSSNNIMMRKAVKNFDDDIIEPFISRFYDWNMQFNGKSEIKGDFNVDARGTSVLLVREMQARNLAEFVGIALGMPGGPEELKVRGVLKNTAKGMQVSANEVLRTDDESEKAIEDAKKNPPVDPEAQKIAAMKELEQMKIEAKRELVQMEMQQRMTIAENERQIAMIERDLEIINRLGLHARAAAKLVHTAGRFNSDISVAKDGETIDAKSILGIMALGAARGTIISIICDGDDETEALEAVTMLIEGRFDEDS